MILCVKCIKYSESVLKKKRFWLAASTHIGEDNFCLKTHLLLKEKYLSFPEEDRKKLESLQGAHFTIQHIKIINE